MLCKARSTLCRHSKTKIGFFDPAVCLSASLSLASIWSLLFFGGGGQESSFQENDYNQSFSCNNLPYIGQVLNYVAIQKQRLVSLILPPVWVPLCSESGRGRRDGTNQRVTLRPYGQQAVLKPEKTQKLVSFILLSVWAPPWLEGGCGRWGGGAPKKSNTQTYLMGSKLYLSRKL